LPDYLIFTLSLFILFMATKHITILAGDGIGPEVTACGKQVLEKVAHVFGHTFTFKEALIGHSAILKTNNPLPDETLEACRKSDAVLLGAVGDPLYDNNPSLKIRPEQGLLRLRKELDLFANLRPIKLFDELLHASSLKPELLKGADILFFRELTGDIYFGTPRERSSDGENAVDTMRYSKQEVRRIAKMAFQAARLRNKKLCSVDKANVLECSRLWREVVQELSKDYPDVEVTHQFVDNAAMQLIRRPAQFDVVLTGNLFGDILTDEASQIAGSLGMLASASVGSQVGVYEPIHGSAPDIAGKNIANPLATILSVSLMLDIAFGWKKEAESVVNAIDSFLKDGWRTKDIADENTPSTMIVGTKEAGNLVVERIG
jgi:3-isopropylmalate dehydrogenase